ncbi:MAG: aldo/keto reductase, partial [Dehalococcoidia bacterium]|nr:aldo/keto reductase [Dehalococcoidia bacterium]
IKLATKLPHWRTNSKSAMNRILDQQLAKLRTDRIDYYLIHALSGDLWQIAKRNGVVEFLDEALKKGKILNAGFSFHGSTEEFNSIVDDYDWTFCQIQYNYLDTHYQAGTAGLRYAASKNMAVMVMEPLRGGNLAKTPPPSVERVWDSASLKRTPVGWALTWLWNQPEVTVVLSGMNKDAHIQENLALADVALPGAFSEVEVKTVEEAAKEFRGAMRIDCTGCQYCMPCPSGVNIPNCFTFYNSKHTFKDRSARFMYLLQNGGITAEKSSLASMCVQCGECLDKCPQRLPIPDLLTDVARDMEGNWAKPLVRLGRRVARIRSR